MALIIIPLIAKYAGKLEYCTYMSYSDGYCTACYFKIYNANTAITPLLQVYLVILVPFLVPLFMIL